MKKKNWHLAIWQNWCFGQFDHSKIEVLQIAQLLAKADALVTFCVSFTRHSNLSSCVKNKTKSEPFSISSRTALQLSKIHGSRYQFMWQTKNDL